MNTLFKRIIVSICVVVVVVYLCFILLQATGPKSIRPDNVEDPILRPVLFSLADKVDANPNDANPRMKLGMTYEGAGMNELAEQTYQQYAEAFPKRVIGWYRLAIVQHKQGKVDDAIFSLTNGAKFAPDTMDAPHWQLAFWYIDVGEIARAKEQLSFADSKRPNSIQVQLAKGKIALEEGNPELAIEILEDNWLIASVPEGYVYQLLGRAYRAIGDEENAKEAWSRAGQKKPNWADPWTQAVLNHIVGLDAMRQKIMKQMQANNLVEVRRLIDEYFMYEQDNRVVRRLDASCDAKQGKIGQALKKFAALIQEEPNDVVTLVLLAKLRMRVSQFQTPEEIEITKEILTTVIEITPDNEQAKTLLGIVSSQ